MLVCALESMNDAVLHDIKAHYRQPTKPYPNDDNPVLGNLDKLLDFVGISNPMAKIYVTSDPLEGLATLLFFFVVATIERLQWFPEFNTLALVSNKGKEVLDGTALAVGVLTLLKQFHPTHTQQFISLLCQYVRSHTKSQTDAKLPQVPHEARKALHFLEMLCKYGPYVDRKDIQTFLPSYLIDNYPQDT
ncbi:hypothetical protein RFI_05744 [Reticulomyxa filosa]|uniref:Uncharacterized protein n=1 Tax=Reticulomyxa filosa TaxID=46433 RepID=X6NZU8_RETFI|nr:hypothetical protein RFI_05744 [Reticulomyxa filosa]|eukprot:ETO31378.1 hypothetical protein RFI_05744 [Reticulomyxa filosa]